MPSTSARPDTSVGRVLLTHILMGHDRTAAVAVRDLASVETHAVDPGDRF